jgi:aldose 1-epimerase
VAAIELSGGDATAVLSPAGRGRFVSLVIAGRERLVTGSSADDPKLWGSYPMAPWAGRIRRGRLTYEAHTYDLPIDASPPAIHGTVCRRPWDVDDDGTPVTELGPALEPGASVSVTMTLSWAA